jgi:hypothetical protein
MAGLDNGAGSQSRRGVPSRGAVSMGSRSIIEILLLRLAPPAAPVVIWDHGSPCRASGHRRARRQTRHTAKPHPWLWIPRVRPGSRPKRSGARYLGQPPRHPASHEHSRTRDLLPAHAAQSKTRTHCFTSHLFIPDRLWDTSEDYLKRYKRRNHKMLCSF